MISALAGATSPESAVVLLNKLNHNVFQPPSTKTVQRAFENWSITLPRHVLDEVGLRNPTAHDFLMIDEASGDFQKAADRTDMIQMLLAAAIAKHVGFPGPIVGWERDDQGYLQVPKFWSWSEIEEANIDHVCSR